MNVTREAVLETVDWPVPVGSSCLPKPWRRGRWGWEEEGGLCVFWSNASSSWSPRLRGFRLLCCREPAPGWWSLCGFFSDFLLPSGWLVPPLPHPRLPILKLLRPTNKNLVPKFLRKTETTVFSFILFYGFLAFLQWDHGKTSSWRGQRSRTFLFCWNFIAVTAVLPDCKRGDKVIQLEPKK